jgi:hypothetical protein
VNVLSQGAASHEEQASRNVIRVVFSFASLLSLNALYWASKSSLRFLSRSQTRDSGVQSFAGAIWADESLNSELAPCGGSHNGWPPIQ